MIEKKIKIKNKAGIHCRPSSVILTAVEEFPGHKFEVLSEKGDCELQSILELLSLGLQYGDSVTIRATGPDDEKACDRIAGLFEYEFDFPPR